MGTWRNKKDRWLSYEELAFDQLQGRDLILVESSRGDKPWFERKYLEEYFDYERGEGKLFSVSMLKPVEVPCIDSKRFPFYRKKEEGEEDYPEEVFGLRIVEVKEFEGWVIFVPEDGLYDEFVFNKEVKQHDLESWCRSNPFWLVGFSIRGGKLEYSFWCDMVFLGNYEQVQIDFVENKNGK